MPLRPPVTIPENIVQFSRWCQETAISGAVDSQTAADANLLNGLAGTYYLNTANHTVSAGNVILGRSSATAGAVQEIACTSAGRDLLDDANAAAQRVTLGLGTAAIQNTGTSGATVPLLNGANIHASGQFTAFGIGTTATQQAANPDTSGAALAALETEVNEIKAVLRTFGLIAT